MQTLQPMNCRYGAPMGRHGATPADTSAARKFSLQRVRLDRGGYDSGGAYWGIGGPLYWACSDDGEAEMFFRAPGRPSAKLEVAKRFPGATFHQ